MQQTSPTTHATPFFSSLFGGEGGKRRKSNGNSNSNSNENGRNDNDMTDPSSPPLPAGEGAPPPALPSKSPKSPRKRPSFGRSRPGTAGGGVVGSGDPNSIPIPAGGDHPQSSAGAASPPGVQLPHAQGPGQPPAPAGPAPPSTLPQLTSSSTTAQVSPITRSSPSGPYNLKTPRPSTSQASTSTSGNSASGPPGDSRASPRQHNVLHKKDPKEKEKQDPPKRENRDRQLSFGRKPSLSSLIHRHRRTASSLSTATGGNGPDSSGGAAQQQVTATPTPTTSAPSSGRSSLSRKPSLHLVTSHSSYSSSAIPPVPGIALAASRLADAVRSPQSATETINFSRMLSRGAPTPVNGFGPSATQLAPPAMVAPGPQSELGEVHARIQETANKRISTLDYLRKAHEGRIYWFNTILFDKPDLQKMPYFNSTKLGRRATNYLLLGLSLPTVLDLNCNNPTEFLRSLNHLLAEFDSFQQLHSENGPASTSSLSRARIPQMFRRATPSAKTRRASSATGMGGGGTAVNGSSSIPAMPVPPSTANGNDPNDFGYALESVPSHTGTFDDSVLTHTTTNSGAGNTSTSTEKTTSTSSSGIPSSTSATSTAPSTAASAVTGASSSGQTAQPTTSSANSPAPISFSPAEQTELLPGEEYTHLLTPNLPFDPDFFETFATLCDVLIDTYTRLLSLVPTPRECNGTIAELFTKADAKIRKIIVQGVIKEFEEQSRAGVRGEVGAVGRVVLGGLM
ncbi:hypothetical protein B0T20DRAFT_74805 [Sordaria brevicollis]|uniref:Uncharacterized protein n=1 Tax=Sordaria brevicollis TaxID=83679 RepID=A0AAE0U681_SORBR|nr:hypothetical protein B0T20DRAFT_74805 [Sordaria brevicollis]